MKAHRAKGLEFDHVAVLERGRCDDIDETRRLYYVAMTRARHTLTLARMEEDQPFQEALSGCKSVLNRQMAELIGKTDGLRRRYVRPTLRELHLGYAGWLDPDSKVHRAIAALAPGSPLRLRQSNLGRWELTDQDGIVVGRMAKVFAPPMGMHCRSAKVFAIITQRREDSDPAYLDRIKCENWEVVVPELVFEHG